MLFLFQIHFYILKVFFSRELKFFIIYILNKMLFLRHTTIILIFNFLSNISLSAILHFYLNKLYENQSPKKL